MTAHLTPTQLAFARDRAERLVRLGARKPEPKKRPRLKRMVHYVIEEHHITAANNAPAYDRPKGSRLDEIKAQVCDAHGVSLTDILSKGRANKYPRWELAYRLHRETRLSWPQIARHCGYTDHSAAMYAAEKHAALTSAEVEE